MVADRDTQDIIRPEPSSISRETRRDEQCATSRCLLITGLNLNSFQSHFFCPHPMDNISYQAYAKLPCNGLSRLLLQQPAPFASDIVTSPRLGYISNQFDPVSRHLALESVKHNVWMPSESLLHSVGFLQLVACFATLNHPPATALDTIQSVV